jgi:hypothetical protein
MQNLGALLLDWEMHRQVFLDIVYHVLFEQLFEQAVNVGHPQDHFFLDSLGLK